VVTGLYFYDGDGNRVKANVDGKATYYIGNYYEKIEEQIEGEPSITIKKYYYAGGVRVAMEDDGDVRYFVTDHLGSTTKMINADGTTFPNGTNFEIEYYSWGADQPDIPDLGTSFKYTGQRQAEAGLYFYNARWYDPKIGRFIQADTIIPSPGNPQAWDRYAYANNNPLYYTDPSGHWSDRGCVRQGCAFSQLEEAKNSQKWAQLNYSMGIYRQENEKAAAEAKAKAQARSEAESEIGMSFDPILGGGMLARDTDYFSYFGSNKEKINLRLRAIYANENVDYKIAALNHDNNPLTVVQVETYVNCAGCSYYLFNRSQSLPYRTFIDEMDLDVNQITNYEPAYLSLLMSSFPYYVESAKNTLLNRLVDNGGIDIYVDIMHEFLDFYPGGYPSYPGLDAD
jgi:RHS repeat-associated protein